MDKYEYIELCKLLSKLKFEIAILFSEVNEEEYQKYIEAINTVMDIIPMKEDDK